MATRATATGEVTIRRHPPSLGAAPANILEEIVWHKGVEIAEARATRPDEVALSAARGAAAVRPPRDFVGALRAKRAASPGGLQPGLIAEVKKASPSKGVIQPDFDAVRIARAYEAGGAACLSVLTDGRFFQGSFANLRRVRDAGVSLPLLAKEFVVDKLQLALAREAGADAALLIAAVLRDEEVGELVVAARDLGLQTLIEVHSEAELERVLSIPDRILDPEHTLLGINNRDLETFVVDLATTARIMASAPGREAARRGFGVACESGIFTPEDVAAARDAGCAAILVGESLVKQGDPTSAVRELLRR